MTDAAPKEGFQILRLVMVLSSMAPLFVLWAVRGSGPIPDKYFVPGCLLLAIVPTLVLQWRIRTAERTNDIQTKTVLPRRRPPRSYTCLLVRDASAIYTVNLRDYREFAATLLALLFILFLFWHLNMHYMNLLFAFKGYRVFTVTPNPADRVGSQAPFVILTKRIALLQGEQIKAYRLSDTVFIEKQEKG